MAVLRIFKAAQEVTAPFENPKLQRKYFKIIFAVTLWFHNHQEETLINSSSATLPFLSPAPWSYLGDFALLLCPKFASSSSATFLKFCPF